MLNEERRNAILEILSQHHRILVSELSTRFSTSPVTIRKDLEILERRGSLHRVHGGAIAANPSVLDLALTEKERLNTREKERIARAALQLIEEGDVIILDSGSTTMAIARQLKSRKGITIITNAVNIASELAGSENEVILIGGTVREKSFSLVGPLSENAMARLTADKLFLGVDGINFEYGFTTPNLLEANINRLMVRAATQVIVTADYSKFGRKSMGVIADLTEAHKIITDSRITETDLQRLRVLGIEVIVA
ncbi:MAG TPA: DeoR/GlpR family DNA-binding transcription regulator [bacterium]|nr:DeoR/GlpR family DNA-binding transcription regulator [bacterium]HQG44656.1 DeoR/GlpR family DNA-binding transcription regulator [bacterium]HQI49346.1 DeoR/GlpR family DNA-binding transcription regulator [bacterium]HQJ63710.1 DeoR/GlpR family DNA-binding transcription regulator [bacterium]